MLTVNDQRLTALSTDDLQYFETRFFLVPGTGTVYVDSKLSVIRQRSVGNGFREELSILNHDGEPADLIVRIEVDCDFADLFEVKDALAKKGTYAKRVDDKALVLDVPARDVRTRDCHLVDATVRVRRERDDIRDHGRSARGRGGLTSTLRSSSLHRPRTATA